MHIYISIVSFCVLVNTSRDTYIYGCQSHAKNLAIPAILIILTCGNNVVCDLGIRICALEVSNWY